MRVFVMGGSSSLAAAFEGYAVAGVPGKPATPKRHEADLAVGRCEPSEVELMFIRARMCGIPNILLFADSHFRSYSRASSYQRWLQQVYGYHYDEIDVDLSLWGRVSGNLMVLRVSECPLLVGVGSEGVEVLPWDRVDIPCGEVCSAALSKERSLVGCVTGRGRRRIVVVRPGAPVPPGVELFYSDGRFVHRLDRRSVAALAGVPCHYVEGADGGWEWLRYYVPPSLSRYMARTFRARVQRLPSYSYRLVEVL